MTNVLAIHSVGESLRRYLDTTYPAALRDRFPSAFHLVASGKLLQSAVDDLADSVTIYLYRVTLNEYLRTAPRLDAAGRQNVPLSLDLHFLVTMWFDDAQAEHTVLAWVMRQLQQHPVLDRATLTPDAEWSADEAIHIVPTELNTDDTTRIWDALEPAYRLSVSYVARVIRIDTDGVPTAPPVVARRLLVTPDIEGARYAELTVDGQLPPTVPSV